MLMSRPLTKTLFLHYLHCTKLMWLSEHHPKLAAPPTLDAQRRLRMGQEVDRLARKLFPNGVVVPYQPQPLQMAKQTAVLLTQAPRPLFQATFAADGLLVKVDILEPNGDGSWHLIEVKGASKLKPEHLPDAGFQLLTVRRAGLTVTRVSIMHLNKACAHPNLDDLFVRTEVTEEVEAMLPEWETAVGQARADLNSRMRVQASIDRHCFQDGKCAFYDHCWEGIDGLTIYHIPRLQGARKEALLATNALYLADVPAGVALTVKQQQFVTLHTQQQVKIDRQAIARALNELSYPLYFFDFETIDTAVPVHDGCVPYQQVPFQYSCHVLHQDGTLTHCAYLHTENSDPRPQLLEALLNDIGETGSIIVYYAPFEQGRLQELAEAFPEHADRLNNMVARLWDQLLIFRKYYDHYQFGGSNSLKSVLPVVVPHLRYSELDVQNGTMAQVIWEKMIHHRGGEEKQQQIKALLAYCHLDTLAMVEIHRHLVALGEGGRNQNGRSGFFPDRDIPPSE